jgi:hypothetical protein
MNRKRIWVSLGAGSFLFVGPFAILAVQHPPDVNPANFTAGQAIDNTYFPQPVGTLFVYEGTTEGVPTHDEVCVTSQTRPPIEGVQVTVVHHRSYELVDNELVLVEDTFDWFAQDRSSNVWYFGEDTTEFPSGSTEGSWEGGVDDADAGFIMLADPQSNDRYYQEFARNVAEDQAKVLSLDESVCLESGACYANVLRTQETSRLDPGVLEYKYYAPDVGFILAEIIKGGEERTELVSTTPNSGCS